MHLLEKIVSEHLKYERVSAVQYSTFEILFRISEPFVYCLSSLVGDAGLV